MADSTFDNHYRRARESGLGFGAYYYSTAMTPAQARAEDARRSPLSRQGVRLSYLDGCGRHRYFGEITQKDTDPGNQSLRQ